MSKTDNLGDFLTDLADAIREKKNISSTTKIPAQNFSSEIGSIESVQKSFTLNFETSDVVRPAFFYMMPDNLYDFIYVMDTNPIESWSQSVNIRAYTGFVFYGWFNHPARAPEMMNGVGMSTYFNCFDTEAVNDDYPFFTLFIGNVGEIWEGMTASLKINTN